MLSDPRRLPVDRRKDELQSVATGTRVRLGAISASELVARRMDHGEDNAGQALPHFPAEGFRSESEFAKISGARTLDFGDVLPGLRPDVYAYSRETVQRNLYTASHCPELCLVRRFRDMLELDIVKCLLFTPLKYDYVAVKCCDPTIV